MKNYTTQTAALKATTVDTRLLDAKQIDTEKLFINGTQFDPSQLKESPNDAMFAMIVQSTGFVLESMKLDQNGEGIFGTEGSLLKGSQTEGILPNGVYAAIELENADFIGCLCGNIMDDAIENLVYIIPTAKFTLVNFENSLKVEQCILENFITGNADGKSVWVIKLCEEDDNLSELYGGIMTGLFPGLVFVISIPYYILENDTPSTSTYSLRKTNLFDIIREKFEQMRQRFEERKQKNIDNPTE